MTLLSVVLYQVELPGRRCVCMYVCAHACVCVLHSTCTCRYNAITKLSLYMFYFSSSRRNPKSKRQNPTLSLRLVQYVHVHNLPLQLLVCTCTCTYTHFTSRVVYCSPCPNQVLLFYGNLHIVLFVKFKLFFLLFWSVYSATPSLPHSQPYF